MAGLESSAGGEGATGPTVVEMPTATGRARVAVPADADGDEVAALVAAIAAQLDGSDGPGPDGPMPVDRWRLAARLGVRRRYELPRQCHEGEEWKSAGRRP